MTKRSEHREFRQITSSVATAQEAPDPTRDLVQDNPNVCDQKSSSSSNSSGGGGSSSGSSSGVGVVVEVVADEKEKGVEKE